LTAHWPSDPSTAIDSGAVSIQGLLVTPELFARLPESAKRVQQRFAPVGKMSLVFQYAKRANNGWDARLETRPEDLAARYHKFPYPMRKVRGRVVSDFAKDQPDRHIVDINVEINDGARVNLRGTVAGAEPFPAVDLWICGDGDQPARNIPLDEDMIAALPPRFSATGPLVSFSRQCRHPRSHPSRRGQPNGHDIPRTLSQCRGVLRRFSRAARWRRR